MAKKLEVLEKEVASAEKGREESPERQELIERLKEEKDKRDKMLVRLKDFAENDPAVLEQMVRETGEAVNRWTDNIFFIQGWIKKKFPSVDQVKLLQGKDKIVKLLIFRKLFLSSLAFLRIWTIWSK